MFLAIPAFGLKVGDKLETLTTKGGRSYQGVTINKISNKEIKIIHASGIATIPVSDLTAELIKDLGIKETPAEPTKKKSGIIKKDEALAPDKYGVRKWPTPLGRSIKWGMSKREAIIAMEGKGFKYDSTIKETDPLWKQVWPEALLFEGGQFLEYKDTSVVLRFTADNKLIRKDIVIANLFIKQKQFKDRSEAVKAAVRLRDTMVKLYGKPTEEDFIVGDRWNGVAGIGYYGDGKELTRAEAIKAGFRSSKGQTFYYDVNWKSEVINDTKLTSPYMWISAHDAGRFRLQFKGPEFWEIALSGKVKRP